MAQVRILSAEEVNKAFTPASRRVLREEEMRPFREAVQQLDPDRPGGIIELEPDENPRLVMMRLHRAARDSGKRIKFQRSGQHQQELRFRLQTPEETERLQERGRDLAASRTVRQQEKERPIRPVPKPSKRR